MSTSCAHCNTELAAGARFCLNCGTPTAAPSPGRGPGDIAMPDTGGIARPPTAPEPDSPWQPGASSVQEPDSPWQPGASGVAPPAAPAPGGPPPAGPAPSHPPYFNPDGSLPQQASFAEAEKSSGGGAKLAAIALGVIGLLLVGFVAFRFIAGGDGVSGGASSPEAVIDEMVEAINAEDPLAVVNLMAPDELDGFDDLVADATELYDTLGIEELLTGEIEERELAVDIEIDADDIDVSMEGENAAIVSFELEGEIEAQGEDNFGVLNSDRETFESSDFESVLPNGSDAVEVIMVKIDGKWFMSPMLTLGHLFVENTNLPAGDYDRIGTADRAEGGSSPVDAVNEFVDAINDLDASALAASLGGGEGRVMLVFGDAIDEGFDEVNAGLDRDGVRFDLSVQTEDIGDGRVQLDEVELDFRGELDDASVTLEDDCITIRDQGLEVSGGCLLDALDLDAELDTTLWLDTVREDGSHRVRVIPSITDVMRRFINVIDDRQTALIAAEVSYLDDATEVDVNTDIDIDFDGQRFTVHEFEIANGEHYNVSATGDTRIELWVDTGFGFDRRFGNEIDAFSDGLVRVVTFSDIDDEFCTPALDCLPTGDGETTLRIRQGARQTVPFPSVLSGQLGPSDVRVFELEVAVGETVEILVTRDSDIRWGIQDDFDIRLEPGVFEFPPGTYELVIVNVNADAPVDYMITPIAR